MSTLTHAFNFRKEIYFHDGHELKSDDVIFTINKIFELNRLPREIKTRYGLSEIEN